MFFPRPRRKAIVAAFDFVFPLAISSDITRTSSSVSFLTRPRLAAPPRLLAFFCSASLSTSERWWSRRNSSANRLPAKNARSSACVSISLCSRGALDKAPSASAMASRARSKKAFFDSGPSLMFAMLANCCLAAEIERGMPSSSRRISFMASSSPCPPLAGMNMVSRAFLDIASSAMTSFWVVIFGDLSVMLQPVAVRRHCSQ